MIFWENAQQHTGRFFCEIGYFVSLSIENYLAHCGPSFLTLGFLTLTSLYIFEYALLVTKAPELLIKIMKCSLMWFTLHKTFMYSKSDKHAQNIMSTWWLSKCITFFQLISGSKNVKKCRIKIKTFLIDKGKYPLSELFRDYTHCFTRDELDWVLFALSALYLCIQVSK